MKTQLRTLLLVGLLFLAACKSEGGGPEGPPILWDPCPEGQASCASGCVSFDDDPLHCGGCDQRCADDEDCVEGRCISRCGHEELFCDSRCIRPDEDRDHCGGCGVRCSETEACEGGACTPLCPPAATRCGDDCVYLQSDSAHCGGCQNACAADESCVNGACQSICEEGTSLCNGRCVSLASSSQHCGACNNPCGFSERCEEGKCVLVCEAWEEACGSVCVNTRSSVAHCGGCDRVCEDRPNATSFCEEGSCGFTCESGYQDCDGDESNGCEVNTLKEVAHCGACNNDCREKPRVLEAACQFAVCVPTICEEGWAHCSGNEEVGCETYLIDNPEHCGACGRACDALPNTEDTSCEGRRCTFTCAPGWADCDGDWTNGCEQKTDDDPLHCGACEKACGAYQVCEQGKCNAREFATWPVQAIDSSRYLVDADAGTTTDLVTGRMWEHRVHPLSLSWNEARAYCHGLSKGGHQDWRLPTRIELLSIVNRSAAGDRPIDSLAFPSTPTMSFWTVSPVAGQSSRYWIVGFQFGTTGHLSEQAVARVRCVRGDDEPPPQRYEVSHAIVRDLWTGLDWEREPSSTHFSLDEAAAHCAGLNLEGERGWRIPTSAELESILDVRVPNPGPTVDATVFLNTQPSTYWSREPNGIFDYWWGVDFKSGGTGSYSGSAVLAVRCVKGRGPLEPSQ